jgi:hypothetical protein
LISKEPAVSIFRLDSGSRFLENVAVCQFTQHPSQKNVIFIVTAVGTLISWHMLFEV